MANPEGPIFTPKGRIIRADDVTAWHEGDAFLAAARAEAGRIIADAQAERERLIAQGHAEGERAGEAAITRRVAEATHRLDQLLDQSESWLANLVVDTVERILGEQDRRECTLAAAVTALRAFRHARRLVVRIPPAAVGWVETGLEQALEPALRALLVIQPDPHLHDGRCVVSSELGIIEAGIDEQIAALRAGLAAQLIEDSANARDRANG